MKLKDLRNKYNLTLKETSILLNMPIRTYIRYENNDKYGSLIKRDYIINKITDKYEINENKGILNIDQIIKGVNKIASKYKDQISFIYLFGSYAKKCPTETSDVDLLISTTLKGLDYIGLSEEIREQLHKKIDLVSFNNLKDSLNFTHEILKYGIKIYGE